MAEERNKLGRPSEDRLQPLVLEVLKAEGQRVHEVVIDAAIDHVHLTQAFGGAHPYFFVLDGEIASFDQLYAHLLCQKSVFEIGGVENSRG